MIDFKYLSNETLFGRASKGELTFADMTKLTPLTSYPSMGGCYARFLLDVDERVSKGEDFLDIMGRFKWSRWRLINLYRSVRRTIKVIRSYGLKQ